MTFIEASFLVIGFFIIWLATAGIIRLIDLLVVKPLFGRTLTNEEYWKWN